MTHGKSQWFMMSLFENLLLPFHKPKMLKIKVTAYRAWQSRKCLLKIETHPPLAVLLTNGFSTTSNIFAKFCLMKLKSCRYITGIVLQIGALFLLKSNEEKGIEIMILLVTLTRNF